MIPKKHKEFVGPVAEKTEMDPQCVRDAVDFYWKSIRTSLSELVELRVVIQGFGYFEIRNFQVPVKILDYENFLYNLSPEKLIFRRHDAIKMIQKDLDDVKKVQVMIDEAAERKNNVKAKRDGKEIIGSVVQSKKDTRRRFK